MHRECRKRFPRPPTSKETASYRSRHASRHVRDARAVMHVRIAYLRWWGKRSRHSQRMFTSNFTYLSRGPFRWKSEPLYDDIQSRAVIRRPNIIWLCPQHNSGWSRTCIRVNNHKRYIQNRHSNPWAFNELENHVEITVVFEKNGHKRCDIRDDVIKWKHFPRYWPFVWVPGEFPAQRPVTRSFDVFFDLCPNKWWSKQSWGWWFETLSCSLWRHCDIFQHMRLTLSEWCIPHEEKLLPEFLRDVGYKNHVLGKWVIMIMMTSSNGNIFRVAGPLCREFTGHRWIPHTRPVTRGFGVFCDPCLFRCQHGVLANEHFFYVLPEGDIQHTSHQILLLPLMAPRRVANKAFVTKT